MAASGSEKSKSTREPVQPGVSRAAPQPYRREGLPQRPVPVSGWVPQVQAEWTPEAPDLGPWVIGPTTWRFILIAALLFLGGAAAPIAVATAIDDAGAVMTILRYSPMDSGAMLAGALLVLMGKRRGWTILRLLVVLTAAVGYLIWRYLTFGSLPIDVGDMALQGVRLGPGWYISALATAFTGVGFFSAVRGHF